MENDDEKRLYFSQRTGRNPDISKIDLPLLKDLFLSLYNYYFEKDYFQENIGACSHDDFQNYYPGKLGEDYEISRMLFLKIRKTNLWPITNYIGKYNENDLFDIIEFCYDNISKPTYKDEQDSFVGYNPVLDGYDQNTAKSEYKKDINKHLKDYDSGYELDSNGEIVIQSGYGLETIYEAQLPVDDIKNISLPVENAIRKFRSRHSTNSDRKDAIRNLVDVLEFLKPKMKKVILAKDEKDLFNIATNFGIRHHNEKQKTNYDDKIWLSWMFYYYLSSIHAIVRLIKKRKDIDGI